MNQPLTAGTIAFITADGRSGSGVINSSGEYAVNDAPVGDVTITVNTPQQPMGPVNMAKPPGVQGMPKEMQPPGYQENQSVKVVPAPKKYNTVEESPLKYTVQPGTQEYPIELKP